MKKTLSLIIPAFNEEAVLAESFAQMDAAMAALPYDYEIIYVEPGKEQLINQMLSSVKEVPPKYIILVEHPEQIAAIHTPNTGGYCTVSSSGEVQYYQIE